MQNIDNVYIVVCVYLFCYVIPTIILDILQLRYVSFYAKKMPVILESNSYKSAAKYAITQRILSIITNIYNFFILIMWLFWGISFLDTYFDTINFSYLAKQWLIAMSFFAINAVLNLPISLINKKIDTKFGFNVASIGLYIKDLIKSMFLAGALLGVLLAMLLWIMDNVELWWVVGFVCFFSVVIIIQLIYPTLIAPLFNKFTPLKNDALANRIENLMQQVGFKSSGIYVMDASKRDGRLNAYFGGLGSSKRVVLFDTLLEKISEDGLVAILGHELGHFKHKDIWKNIFIAGVILFAIFAIMGIFFKSFCDFLGFANSYSNIIIFSVLFMPLLTFIIMPISSYFSRKAEYKADEFGAKCVSQKALREALIRLVNENKAFPYSHPAYVFFYYSHPPLIDRLKALGA